MEECSSGQVVEWKLTPFHSNGNSSSRGKEVDVFV